MKTLRNWVWDESLRAVGIYTGGEVVVRVWEERVVVLGGMVVWCMRVFWVEVGVLWGYLEACTRFHEYSTYLTGMLRRWGVEAVGLDGGKWQEWGSGRVAGMEDVGMVKFKRGRGCLRRLEVLCSVYSIKGAGYGRFMVWSVVGEGRWGGVFSVFVRRWR
jgi:hypothetical protein